MIDRIKNLRGAFLNWQPLHRCEFLIPAPGPQPHRSFWPPDRLLRPGFWLALIRLLNNDHGADGKDLTGKGISEPDS